jgi:hypothetical protein
MYAQVGNAVPPPLARAVGEAILRCHFAPTEAETWGQPGRITVSFLDDVLGGRRRFPVVTPRHPVERRTRRRTRRPATVDVVATMSDGSVMMLEAKSPAEREPDSPLPTSPSTGLEAAFGRLCREAAGPASFRAAKRARAILGIYAGQSIEVAAQEARVSPEAVVKWVSDFRRGGADGWRAYHTAVDRLTADAAFAARLVAAVEAVRMPDDHDEQTETSTSSFRPHMSERLRQLIARFRDLSVSDLLALAENCLGVGVGTLYLQDLLAICGEVYAASADASAIAPTLAVRPVQLPLLAKAG